MNKKEKQKQIQQNLKLLHPDIYRVILDLVTIEDIADRLKDGKKYDEKSPFIYILHKNKYSWRLFCLQSIGVKRSKCWYTHMFYTDHLVQVDDSCTVNELSPYIHNPKDVGKRHHMLKMLHCIQSISNDDNVELFMIGKASAQYGSKSVHAHTGMVNRFGNKYKAIGYSMMVGLCVLDGSIDPAAELRILTMEQMLHDLYTDHPKFHVALSNASSGALSQTPENAFFTLYIAVRFYSDRNNKKK